MAYIASLSALFSSPESCTGKVSCSVCGDRPNHYLRGDIASIREGIADTLGLALDEGRDVSALVGSVYSKQRSAYVHDAVLRRSELKDFPVNIHRPTENSPVSDELQFAEDLHDIQRLTRRCLVAHLGGYSQDVKTFIPQESMLPIRLTHKIGSSVTVARAGHPVGIRVRPS